MQFCVPSTNWYSPVSSKPIDVSVAEMVVTMVALRGSPAGVPQRVRQKRGDALCDVTPIGPPISKQPLVRG